jgi:hypothetical protein
LVTPAEWLVWTRWASVIMSFSLTLLLLFRYLSKRQAHIAIWSTAWALVGFRVLADIYLQLSIMGRFIVDLMTLGHDMLWYLGIATVLGFTGMKRGFSLIYFVGSVLLSAYFYFGLGNMVLGAAVTVIFTHPIILLVLAWFFFLSWRKTKHIGVAIISISFVLWALDYIIFGIPYFGLGDVMAGVYGWSIGLIFRVAIFIGFVILITKKPAKT